MRASPVSPSLWLLLLLLCASVGAVYWPGLGGAFVFDDFSNIVDNAKLRVNWDSGWREWLDAALSSPSLDLPRPLAMLSFAVNHAWTGLDPYWMKLANLAIHVANTVLVFGVIQTLHRLLVREADARGAQDKIALWVSAAWALNPINLMAVLFVVQRMEGLCHSFVFAGLWLYLSGRLRLIETGTGWIRMSAGIVGGAGLGILVKESAALLPLYALLVEWALPPGTRRDAPRDWRFVLFFGLLLVLPAALGLSRLLPRALHADAYAGRDFGLLERLLTEARVLVDYVHWTLLPNLSQLSLYHDDYAVSRGLWTPPSTLFALLLLAAALGLALWLRKRRPAIALGIVWFLGAHALTASVWALELVFEHRNYFASLGLCLILGDVLLRLPQGTSARRAGWALGWALLAFYASGTGLRALEWSDQLRFSVTEAAKHPQSPRATYDLARNLVILTDFQKDSPYFAPALEALDQAMRVTGSTPLPESGAILLASRAGTPIRPEWWVGLKRKLGTRMITRADTGALATLVNCQVEGYCRLPQAEMVDTFLVVLDRGPHAEVLNLYARYALLALGDPALALTLWEEAAQWAPQVAEYQSASAQLLIASGRPTEAIPYIERLGRLGRWGRYEAQASELLRQAQARSPSEPRLPTTNRDK